MKAEEIMKNNKGIFLKSLIKGAFLSLSISLIAICVFAFLLRFLNININLINPINQVIKIGSILIGVFIGLKNVKEMGLFTGFMIGIIYTILSFTIFSFLNGGFVFKPSLINDMLFDGIAGAIAGVVAVNFKAK